MRFRTPLSVSVCVFAVGLVVAGCSPSNSSSSAAGAATTGSGSTAQAGTGTPSPASSQQAQAAAADSRCQAQNLSFSLADGSQMDGSQWEQPVDMTNKGSSACTMEGFPVVDLIGDTTSQPTYDWTLARSSANGTAKVTLPPGATAHFDLVYLSGDLASGGGSENVLAVQEMVIKVPGDPNDGDTDIQGKLDWFQSVVLQDAATHPGTYVMPVASGS